MNHMDSALVATGKNDLSPHHIGAIALSYAEVGGPSDAEVMGKLASAAMTLEPWVLEVDAMANIVKVCFEDMLCICALSAPQQRGGHPWR